MKKTAEDQENNRKVAAKEIIIKNKNIWKIQHVKLVLRKCRYHENLEIEKEYQKTFRHDNLETKTI